MYTLVLVVAAVFLMRGDWVDRFPGSATSFSEARSVFTLLNAPLRTGPLFSTPDGGSLHSIVISPQKCRLPMTT